MNIVVDASILVAALTDDGRDGEWAESVLAAGDLHAPELIFPETTNVLRRLERSKLITTLEACAAQDDLQKIGLRAYSFAPFAERVWDLRHNLTSYDAWSVAIAEALDLPLATFDRALRRSSGILCEFLTP